MRTNTIVSCLAGAALAMALAVLPANAADDTDNDTYSADEIVQAASNFFGVASEGVAMAVQRIFEEKGRPNAYIVGEEGAGAIGVGLRYGEGDLNRKNDRSTHVYWQGPSVGFDVGANASKVFTLVYNLPNNEAIFQRFPGVEGSYYLVAGIGVNYQQSGDIILAPMRTGVGLRAGANVGYLSYTDERRILPF